MTFVEIPVYMYVHCISGELEGEKLLGIHRKREFRGENIHRLTETNHRWMQHTLKLVENFCGWF